MDDNPPPYAPTPTSDFPGGYSSTSPYAPPPQQPNYGYPPQQQQPGYGGYPPQPQQPDYGYPPQPQAYPPPGQPVYNPAAVTLSPQPQVIYSQPTAVYAVQQPATVTTVVTRTGTGATGSPLVFFMLGFCFGPECWLIGSFWACSSNREDRSWGLANLVFTVLAVVALIIVLVLLFGVGLFCC